MKTRQTIFCSIGAGIGGLATAVLVANIFNILVGRNYPARAHPGSYLCGLAFMGVLMVCLGGGGLSNLISNRLKPMETTMMIVAYCLTCVLTPLGIWGIVELRMAADRRSKRDRATPSITGRRESFRDHSSFAPWTAALSWFLPVGGFIAVILAGSTHQRPLITLTIFILTLGMLVSLACGIYALLCVREQGKKGILLPALIGTAISGFFVLVVVVGLIVGFVTGANEARQLHRSAPVQTNGAAY